MPRQWAKLYESSSQNPQYGHDQQLDGAAGRKRKIQLSASTDGPAPARSTTGCTLRKIRAHAKIERNINDFKKSTVRLENMHVSDVDSDRRGATSKLSSTRLITMWRFWN